MFTRIDHVGIAVVDLEMAKDFYATAFDLHVVHEEANEEQGVREAMLQVGDGESMLQLLAPLRPDSPIARFLDRKGPGIQHIAYTVEDLDTVCSTLRTAGRRLLFDHPRRGTAGSRINFLHPKDGGGVLIELVERWETGGIGLESARHPANRTQ